MAQITAFGKEVKKRLVDLDKKQVWLIEQVQERTNLYFDDSYLYKVLTGQLNTPKIVQAIPLSERSPCSTGRLSA